MEQTQTDRPLKRGRGTLSHVTILLESLSLLPLPFSTASPFSSNWHLIRDPCVIGRDQYRRRTECRGRLRPFVNCNQVRHRWQCLPPSIKATQNTNTPTASCSSVWDLFAVVGAWSLRTQCFGFTEARHCYFSVHQIVCHEMFPFQNLKEKAKFISQCILVWKLPQRPFFPCRAEYIHLEATTKEVLLN